MEKKNEAMFLAMKKAVEKEEKEMTAEEAADELLSAQEEAAKENHVKGNPLSDFPDLATIGLDLNMEKMMEEGRKTRQYAEVAGGELAGIESKIETLKRAMKNDPDLQFSKGARETLAKLENDRRRLLNIKDEAVLGRMEFSKLLKQIEMTDSGSHSAMAELFKLLSKEGRGRKMTREELATYKDAHEGKLPPGPVFFDGERWNFRMGNIDDPSGAEKAIESEVRKKTMAYAITKVSRMAEIGNHDLNGLHRGLPGRYYLHSPRKRDEKTGKIRLESHTVVEIYNDNKGKDARPYLKMRVEDAFGGTLWMLKIKKPFPVFWFEKGRVLAREDDRRYTDEEKEHIGHVIKVLNGILFSLEKEQKKEIKPSETPLPLIKAEATA